MLRGVIAKNVAARAKRVFPVSTNIPMDIRAASADGEIERIAKSTVQRILEAKASATLEQLEKLARALEILPYQLLIPDLDPANPQVVMGATEEENQLYIRIAKAAALEALRSTSPGFPLSPKKHRK